MSLFDPQRFTAVLQKKSRGPAEKRRLARRRAERQGKTSPTKPYVAPVYKPPVPKTPEQTKQLRVTRRAKRLRRKIRQRQIMAANSGLPELLRRSLGAEEVARRTRQRNKPAHTAPTSVVLPCFQGEPKAAEAIDSNCVRTVGRKNLPRQEHATDG
jgi:hypothetical protein